MNSPTRVPNACGVVRLRMPEGFCPPFQCQRGIMAKSTMHQPKAMPTHSLSVRWAGVHHSPCGESRPVCVSMCMGGSGKRCVAQAGNLPQAPAGVEEDHHQDAEREEQVDV